MGIFFMDTYLKCLDKTFPMSIHNRFLSRNKRNSAGLQIRMRNCKLFSYFSTKTYVVGSFKHPKHMFNLIDKKIIAILRWIFGLTGSMIVIKMGCISQEKVSFCINGQTTKYQCQLASTCQISAIMHRLHCLPSHRSAAQSAQIVP